MNSRAATSGTRASREGSQGPRAEFRPLRPIPNREIGDAMTIMSVMAIVLGLPFWFTCQKPTAPTWTICRPAPLGVADPRLRSIPIAVRPEGIGSRGHSRCRLRLRHRRRIGHGSRDRRRLCCTRWLDSAQDRHRHFPRWLSDTSRTADSGRTARRRSNGRSLPLRR